MASVNEKTHKATSWEVQMNMEQLDCYASIGDSQI